MAEAAKDQGPTPVSITATSSQEKPAVLIVGGLGTSKESRPDGVSLTPPSQLVLILAGRLHRSIFSPPHTQKQSRL